MTLASNGLANAIPFRWTYADATARAAASGFTSADLYSLALQLDNASAWILTATTPTWAAAAGTPGMADVTSTKGDLIGRSSSAVARLGVGSDGQELVADSTQTLGVKWATPALVKLGETLLGSAAATMSIGSIPGGYRALLLEAFGRLSVAGDYVFIRFNGDTGGNYDEQRRTDANTVIAGGSALAQTKARLFDMPGSDAPTDVGGGAVVDIPYYANTTWQKQAFARSGVKNANSSGNYINRDHTIWWRSTAAITAIELSLASGNFNAGSIMVLYGLA